MTSAAVAHERESYDALYTAGHAFTAAESLTSFQDWFTEAELSPFGWGGNTKGLVRGLAFRKMISDLRARFGDGKQTVRILDAGCGFGTLSVYLASLGFSVVSVDLSRVAVARLQDAAQHLGLTHLIEARACSLESIPVDDHSIDAVIGFASLHHFVKYQDVSKEFCRILKLNARGYFADGFGENRAYHIFHNKALMRRLGDVILTRHIIQSFFGNAFDVMLYPADWVAMLDKLYEKVTRGKAIGPRRRLSQLHYLIDRAIPMDSSLALLLSGSVFTQVERCDRGGRLQIGRLDVRDLLKRPLGRQWWDNNARA